jgi:hypothetical protein
MHRIIALAIVAALGATAQSQPGQNADGARNVRLRPGHVDYDIQLSRGADKAVVPVDYHFQSGDRLTLRVRVDKPSYVYVLNRTLVGSPDELKSSRQIKLIQEDAGVPSVDAHEFALVYPQSGHRLLKAGTVNLIPGSDFKLELDDNPGVEQLVMMVSPVQLSAKKIMASAKDIAEMHANTRNIEFVAADTAPAPTPPGPSPNPTPVHPRPECTATPSVPSKPFLVDIVLGHYSAERP